MRAIFIIVLTLAAPLGGCALLPDPAADGRAQPEDVATFVRLVEEDIEAHEWQNLLAVSDPALYRARVADGGTPEPVFLAELLGLARPGNRIQEGEELEWADLARIRAVTLVPADDGDPPHRFSGQALLETGVALRLDLEVTRIQGRFVLTDRAGGAGGG